MSIPLPARIAILVIAFLSIFWLPWTITLVCLFFAGLVFPPAALALGVFADLMYYPGQGLFWGTLAGAAIALFSAAVRHFAKTRIM